MSGASAGSSSSALRAGGRVGEAEAAAVGEACADQLAVVEIEALKTGEALGGAPVCEPEEGVGVGVCVFDCDLTGDREGEGVREGVCEPVAFTLSVGVGVPDGVGRAVGVRDPVGVGVCVPVGVGESDFVAVCVGDAECVSECVSEAFAVCEGDVEAVGVAEGVEVLEAEGEARRAKASSRIAAASTAASSTSSSSPAAKPDAIENVADERKSSSVSATVRFGKSATGAPPAAKWNCAAGGAGGGAPA